MYACTRGACSDDRNGARFLVEKTRCVPIAQRDCGISQSYLLGWIAPSGLRFLSDSFQGLQLATMRRALRALSRTQIGRSHSERQFGRDPSMSPRLSWSHSFPMSRLRRSSVVSLTSTSLDHRLPNFRSCGAANFVLCEKRINIDLVNLAPSSNRCSVWRGRQPRQTLAPPDLDGLPNFDYFMTLCPRTQVPGGSWPRSSTA